MDIVLCAASTQIAESTPQVPPGLCSWNVRGFSVRILLRQHAGAAKSAACKNAMLDVTAQRHHMLVVTASQTTFG